MPSFNRGAAPGPIGAVCAVRVSLFCILRMRYFLPLRSDETNCPKYGDSQGRYFSIKN